MKTTAHVAIILVLGVALGLVGRSLRQNADRQHDAQVPGPDDVVFTPDVGPGQRPLADAESIAKEEVVRPPEAEAWLSRFELTERSGELIKSEDLLGTPYVVSFFFTTCPSVCPQQNKKLKELQDEFAGRDVKFLAISVDPETDTPEVLREYAARFGADPEQWLFLTGELDYIRRIAAEIFQQPVDKGFHTERFVLVDADGKIEGMYSWPESVQMKKLQAAIESMLSS